jgi:Flp pilus assembly protein TadG
MNRFPDTGVSTGTGRSKTTARRVARRRDETGTALVELALVVPLVILIMGVAFNGWNGMQASIRLTSAARAGAIVAANDLSTSPAHPQPTSVHQAQVDATAAINNEEGASGVYQDDDSGANNYVNIGTSEESADGATINVVTITISHGSGSFVPFVGSFPVTTHATARYS